ncbi:EF-hand domain pair [Babesia duncani]|uniref:EF-hand domain pair n=1 Tax=Babesia duncani TaxID=323732 RepID=A0AAD9PI19_9APIC|nr:EF-hand domain pair [Babesia duncani]KAK2194592.1 EF-hand domain pair [Babesia duncani]KAK2195230.1 EF-hand domain pair [Babesia duncani]
MIQPFVEQVCHVFSTNGKGTLDHRETLRALSALKVTFNEQELLKRLRGQEINKQGLQDLYNELQVNNYTKQQLETLLTDLMPHGNGTISKSTLQYIMQSQYKLPADNLRVFFRHLNFSEKQEIIPVHVLAENLVALLQNDPDN